MPDEKPAGRSLKRFLARAALAAGGLGAFGLLGGQVAATLLNRNGDAPELADRLRVGIPVQLAVVGLAAAVLIELVYVVSDRLGGGGKGP